MKKDRKLFKKGAASFYVVVFSTLVLVIIAASFATIIISEIARTINDDLSQSAYDSAVAGIEDAKIAFSNYMNCIKNNETYPDELTIGSELTCQDIVYFTKHPDCDMVAHILGRIGKFEVGSEVMIQETNTANNMMQAYTCVKMDTLLANYRATLSESTQMRLIKINFNDVNADEIKAIKISWYSDINNDTYGGKLNFTNFRSSSGVTFPGLTSQKAASPPTISFQLIQTGNSFGFDDFTTSIGDTTNRGTVFLVPSNDAAKAAVVGTNYNGVYNGVENIVPASAFIKSNDKTSKNLPSVVYCSNEMDGPYACTATLMLPKPVGGTRNDETFMVAVSLPYGRPNTDFELEFICDNLCNEKNVIADDGTEEIERSDRAELDNVQVDVDSTGRANDLYRRIETRLESESAYFPYPLYAIQLLGNSGDSLLKKDLKVICEWNFPERGC